MHRQAAAIAAASLLAVPVAARAELLITEIMHNPAGGNEHEFVELYNSGTESVDLAGYVLGDFDFNFSTLDNGSVPAGGTAVLVRVNPNNSRPFANYPDAWGSEINFVATPDDTWPVYTNAGDTVTLYGSFADLQADFTESQANGSNSFGRAVDTVNYAEPGFPATNDASSIYLSNVTLDNDQAVNWALSVAGVDGAYQATSPRASDIGSPGFVVVPEPASAGLAIAGLLLLARRRR